jgi:hypothetical protein
MMPLHLILLFVFLTLAVAIKRSKVPNVLEDRLIEPDLSLTTKLCSLLSS